MLYCVHMEGSLTIIWTGLFIRFSLLEHEIFDSLFYILVALAGKNSGGVAVHSRIM